MPAARPARRYNRLQRALLLIRHYGKSRIEIPLVGFTLLIACVTLGIFASFLISYAVSCLLARLFSGGFILERDFMNVCVPCMLIFGIAGGNRLLQKSERWEAKLFDAMTIPPPAEINEILPESELLVRASHAAASDSLLSPAFAPPDTEPDTLLRAANAATEKFPGAGRK